MLKILNKDVVNEEADNLLIETSKIEKNIASVNYVINNINTYWNSTGTRKDEILTKIIALKEELENIVSVQKEIGYAVNDYIASINDTSSKSAGGAN